MSENNFAIRIIDFVVTFYDIITLLSLNINMLFIDLIAIIVFILETLRPNHKCY